MYTISAMPKNKDIKGEFILFQFKLYGEELDKWTRIRWRAIERAVEKRVRVDDSAVRRALLGMRDSYEWLVTAEERRYFQGRASMPDSLKDVLIPLDGALRNEMGDRMPATPEESTQAHPKNGNNKKERGK